MKKSKIIKRFKQFLRDEGVATQFYVNCYLQRVNRVDTKLKVSYPSAFLDSFIWEDTEEGFEFWQEIDNEWFLVLYELSTFTL